MSSSFVARSRFNCSAVNLGGFLVSSLNFTIPVVFSFISVRSSGRDQPYCLAAHRVCNNHFPLIHQSNRDPTLLIDTALVQPFFPVAVQEYGCRKGEGYAMLPLVGPVLRLVQFEFHH